MAAKSRRFQVGVALALAVLSRAASADYYLFQMAGDFDATWTLPSPVAPTGLDEGYRIYFWDVPGTFEGQISPVVDIYFSRNLPNFTCGGIHITDWHGAGELVSTCGPTLYTLPESQATFRLGTFEMTSWPGDVGYHTITISLVTEVPEPESVALMLAGLGLLAGSMALRIK